jgi:DeoR-like helix-turn-helix domain
MILIHKFEPVFVVEEKHFDIIRLHDELLKILDFIDLPENIVKIEQQNSSIVRNYYANAIDHNLVDIKTVKYIVNQNIRAKGVSERAVEQFWKAEKWLDSQLEEPLNIGMIHQLQRMLINDVYNNKEDINLFSSQTARVPERLSLASEMEIEALFEFINSDEEYHPIHQSWILHFRLIGIKIFSEAKSKMALLLQHFWLKKKGYDLNGLLSIEHEIHSNKNNYLNFIFETSDEQTHEQSNDLNAQLSFGMELYEDQLERLKLLFQKYFRKQVEFDKLNPRQKNIMNYVFERGYKLKEIDDSILNKRQKLIMYIIQNKGFVSTKELVSEFDCNRKTIQRDFTELTNLNLVRVISQGAGLRYAVNLNEEKNSVMEKYQADFLRVEENCDMAVA